MTYLSAKEEGGCAESEQPETPATHLTFSFTHRFKPHSLYTAEMVTESSSEEQVLYTFQFTTSRYATFTEHILSAYASREIAPIVFPEISLRAEVDISGHKNGLNAVAQKHDEFEAITGALNKYRHSTEMQALVHANLLQGNRTFEELDKIARSSFKELDMEDRPLPEHFEIFWIPIAEEGGNIWLVESPEPIAWNRIEAKAKQISGRGRRTFNPLRFVSNQDQTRAFVYHDNGHFFPDQNFEFRLTFHGDPPDPQVDDLFHKNGRTFSEEVTFTLG